MKQTMPDVPADQAWLVLMVSPPMSDELMHQPFPQASCRHSYLSKNQQSLCQIEK